MSERFTDLKNRIKKQHIAIAFQKLDRQGYESKYESKYYYVVNPRNNKLYPPKEIIRIACEIATGKRVSPSGGEQGANKFLREKGFKIVNKWSNPLTIRNLLENMNKNELSAPPERKGVYIITQMKWKNFPTKKCKPLYVGSGGNLLKRIGDTIIDALGFIGHSSGGQSIYNYCKKKNINPQNLYIAWTINCHCHQCDELRIFEDLKPLLNKIKPAKCSQHEK